MNCWVFVYKLSGCSSNCCYCHGSNDTKILIWQGKIYQTNLWCSGVTEKMEQKGHVWKESGVATKGKMEVEVATLLLGNDGNNVIANKVLSYF